MHDPSIMRHSSENLRSYSSFQENFNKYPKRNSNDEQINPLGGIIESPLLNVPKKIDSSPEKQYSSQKHLITASSSFDDYDNRYLYIYTFLIIFVC